MHQSREQIMAHLENLSSGINAQEYLKSLVLADRARTGIKKRVEYYSPKLGSSIVFMTQASNADANFSAENYVHGKYDTDEWVKMPTISDKFRASAGMFWADKIKQVPRNQRTGRGTQLCYLINAYSDIGSRRLPIKMHFDAVSEAHEQTDGSTIEWVLIEGNKNLSTPEAMASSQLDAERFHKHLLHCHDNTPTQYDHTISAPRLRRKETIEQGMSGLLAGYADIHGDYNYYDCNYEEVATNRVEFPEASFPNMYVFFAFQESPNPNPSFGELLSLYGRIDITNHQDMFTLPNMNAQLRATPTEKYFYTWTDKYIQATRTGDIARLARKYKNIMLTVEDIKKMSEYAYLKEMFTKWMHVEFKSDTMTEFAQTIKESNLKSLLQQSIMRRITTGHFSNNRTF